VAIAGMGCILVAGFLLWYNSSYPMAQASTEADESR